MKNEQKITFTEILSGPVECWEKAPVIVNGIDSYNFYRSQLLQTQR